MSRTEPNAYEPNGGARKTVELMAMVDSGLFLFAWCPNCQALMPHNVQAGMFGPDIWCPRCDRREVPEKLRFLTRQEARDIGWRMEDRPSHLAG